MRNVTIVESNVEPNKEHLWFYNGKLKWFGPNGWEEIYSQALSPTTTPKPVVPPTTTTTSTAPGPGVDTTPIGVRVYNYMDVTIDTIVFGANSVNRYIPANGDVYIEGVYPSTSGGNITLYIKARGSTSSGAQVNRLLDVNIMGEISGTSIEQYKSILNEGTIDIPYTGSDALHSISLVVSISDGDTTTTSSPIPGSDVRFTNNTNTDIQIYGVLYNGDTASPPMQPGQTYILRYISDGVAVYNSPDYRPFDSLKITAFRGKKQEDVPYIIDTDTISGNGVMYKFPEGLSWEEITEISIEGSIQGTGTTSSTPTPNSIKFTNMTNVSLTLHRVNSVDEGLQSPPIQPNQQYILVHNANDANTDSYIEIFATFESDVLPPFSFLKITAFKDGGQEYDVPYVHYQDAMGTNLYKFSFKELIEKGFTTVSINGNISNPTTTTTTTTSSSTPTPITEQEILVSNEFIGEDGPTFGITMDDNINFNNVVPSRLESLEPYREGIYVNYTPSSRYLAVVSPKTNGFKDTIVATILVPVGGSLEYESHTLYPINSREDEINKEYLFDLSKSPYVGTAAYSNPCVKLHNYNSHSISSIPPFIDGNTPPFADEK